MSVALNSDRTNLKVFTHSLALQGFHGYGTFVTIPVSPLSRGSVSWMSNSMLDPPIIIPQWLTNPTDVELAIQATKRARQIMASPALAPIRLGSEVMPGEETQTDAQILEYIRDNLFMNWHAAATCKMGRTNDSVAVVDSKARVIGVQNLRVVDASAFALLPPGHPISTVYGLAEKIAAEMTIDLTLRAGGGFSHYFARPAWQNTAVEKYLDILGSEHAGMFERSGAAYPDVSAQGYQYAIIWNGTKHLVDGTSASAPTFAAIVALLNDALLAVGRPVLGFLNPLIWEAGASGQGFTDITSGNNKGRNGTGFPATDGWDPASGWGTPWFPALKDLTLHTRYRSQRPWYMQ